MTETREARAAARARLLGAAAACALAAALAGCPGPGPAPAGSAAPSPDPGSAAAAGSAAAGPAAPPTQASEEERLVAIQKAMNELDEAAQACWAASAAEEIDTEGELVATIDIAPAGARVAFARDTTKTPALAACVAKVLSVYRWAPSLHGQAIQLPFRFRAPDGQSVIDRRLVPWKAQGKVGVAVLLDEQNTRNGAASMFEIALAAGGATGARIAQRPELWYFLHPATVEVTGPASRRAVAAGDMMYVPAGAARNVIAGPSGEVRAVVVMTPGGREGAARAGALLTPELGAVKAGVPGPVHLPAAAARRYPRPAGAVTLFAEPATIKDRMLAASVLELPKGAAIPEHIHATESELLYILAGAGTMTVKGVPLAVHPSSVVQIPFGAPHSFTATEDVRAVQIYTPAGPEQRFKAPAPAPGSKTKP
jgi:quercetin dioxygenase-like cupin family protein